ncbi:MAG TPA: hypothetical protein VH143_07160 [Kofleriaceae bacterium]|jgi:hypothetical protein|nr:hypothetical protein [Kofleriaceae bacterium]
MRTVILAALALAACKGPPKHNSAPANAQTGSAAAPDIVLPHSDGSPIKPTTAKIDPPTMQRLQNMSWRGFNAKSHGFNADKGMMEMQQRTSDHPAIWVVITIAPCNDNAVMVSCLPMELAKWNSEPRYSELKAIVPEGLRKQEDTIFEVGTTDLDGTKMIFTYQLGQTTSHPGGSGSNFNPGGFSYTDAYFLYYNDGVNTIRVVAEYKDDPRESKEKMAEAVPKGDLENVARAFMDAYVHAW